MKVSVVKITGFFALFFAAGLLVSIQAQPGRGGMRGQGRPMQGRMMGQGHMQDSTSANFSLTDEQKEKMAVLQKEHQAGMKKLRDEYIASVEKVLTPEQFPIWKARQARMMMMMMRPQGRMGMRGHQEKGHRPEHFERRNHHGER